MQDEFSSSNVVAEAAVVRTIETDVIPVLEKLQKVNLLISFETVNSLVNIRRYIESKNY